MRDNDLLDSAIDGEPINSTRLPKQRKRRRAPGLTRDVLRRRAFRVLALLSDLDARERDRVLKTAVRINKA